MKRVFLYGAILVLTFAIGVFVNSLVLRAAYHFIPDYDPRPRVEAAPQPEVFIECGKNRHLMLENKRPRFRSEKH